MRPLLSLLSLAALASCKPPGNKQRGGGPKEKWRPPSDSGAGPAAPKRRANVLLVMADQWRATAFSSGRLRRDATVPATPHLDFFFDTAARFHRAYAANPLCSPSRASLLTGRWPHQHGVRGTNLLLPRAEWSLIEPFRALNYSTHYIGKVRPRRSQNPHHTHTS